MEGPFRGGQRLTLALFGHQFQVLTHWRVGRHAPYTASDDFGLFLGGHMEAPILKTVDVFSALPTPANPTF
jgi:hypothetical protein